MVGEARESKEEIAKRTALGGIENEKEIAERFNNWRTDVNAQEWLKIMMYNIEDIQEVKATEFGGKSYKSDVLVTVTTRVTNKGRQTKEATSIENIQVKLVSGKSGSNQVERKHVSSYEKPWHMPSDIKFILQSFCGELKPYKNDTRSPIRMYMDEMKEGERDRLKEYLYKNKVMIISDIIRGRGRFSAEWILVVHKYDGYKFVLKSINEAINHYVGDGCIEFTPRGGIRIGNITLQRKGGDNGEDSANMLQFKANPLGLFDELS